VAYSEILLDHFSHPRNAGEIEAPDGEGSITNPACGDIMRLQLRIRDGVIEEAKWRVEGCSTSIAASSIISDLIAGLTVEEAVKVSRADVAEALGGLPPAKTHSAVLVTDAVKAAVADYVAKRPAAAPPRAE